MRLPIFELIIKRVKVFRIFLANFQYRVLLSLAFVCNHSNKKIEKRRRKPATLLVNHSLNGEIISETSLLVDRLDTASSNSIQVAIKVEMEEKEI